jgi:hypothetical protein
LDDVVEKVGGTLTTCNNRIAHDDFLNLSCAFDACFESILPTAPPQNRFSTASTHSGYWLCIAAIVSMPVSAPYQSTRARLVVAAGAKG